MVPGTPGQELEAGGTGGVTTVLLEDEGQTTGREATEVLPLTLRPSFSLPCSVPICPCHSHPHPGTTTGPRRSPWKRSRPCSLTCSCDPLTCLSVSKFRQGEFLFLCVLPGALSESAGARGRPRGSPGRAALHGTRGRRRDARTHRHTGSQALSRLPPGKRRREDACGSPCRVAQFS